MKKIAILILSILIAGLFVACNQDITVDAQTYANMEVGTFVLNGQNYATLQAAVDAIGSKAAGNNVIKLTKNASGPGAKIANKDVTIDFQGFTYSFTNVNGLQGQDVTGKDFGLSITTGSDVVLKGLQKIDLNDKTTTDLTMVYVEGATTSLTIEDAPKMEVANSQYVFWAADGASLTIGGKDATESATVTGKVAATGTSLQMPTVTVQGATTLAGGVKAESAKVTLAGESKVTGSIDVKASTVSVSEAAKIEVDLTAKDNSEVVINTVSAGAEASTIKTMDKDGESTVVVAGGGVNVEEVATGSDNIIVVVDSGTATGDIETDETTTVYVAKNIRKSVYTTLNAALADASDGDEIKLLENITGEEEITNTKTVTVDLNGMDVGTGDSPVTLILTSGTLSVKDSTTDDGIVFINYEGTGIPSEDALKLYGGKFSRFEDSGHYFDAIWEYLGEGYKFNGAASEDEPICQVVPIAEDDEALLKGRVYTLESAIGYASSGDTIELLQNVTITTGSSNRFPISKSITLDGNGNTVSINNRGFGVGMNATSPVDVTFKDITINNSSSDARCIDTRGNLNSLTLDKVILSTNEATSGYTQPLTIGGNQATPATINIKDSTIQTKEDATAYYAIIIFNPVNMTIDNSTLKGWACLYLKGADGSVGSHGSNIVIRNNSNIISKNIYNGETNAFGAIVFEDAEGSSNVTIENSSIDIKANSDQIQAFASYQDHGIPGIVELKSGVVMTANGENAELQLNNAKTDEGVVITGGTYNIDPSDYVAKGYVARKTGEVWIVEKADTEEVEADGTKMSLVDFAKSVNSGNTYAGKTVTLLKDVDLAGIAWTPIGTSTNPFCGTFDGDGKKIINLSNGGYTAESTVFNTNPSSYSSDAFALFKSVSGTAVIKDFSVSAYIYGTGRYTAAVLSGDYDSTEKSVTIEKVTVDGIIVAKERISGVIGLSPNYGNYASLLTINSCVNNASIKGDRAAGILSNNGCGTDTATGHTTVKDCINTGTIISLIDGGENIAAGIICNTNTTDPNRLEVINCSNTGKIYAKTAYNLTANSYIYNNEAGDKGISIYGENEADYSNAITDLSLLIRLYNSYTGGACLDENGNSEALNWSAVEERIGSTPSNSSNTKYIGLFAGLEYDVESDFKAKYSFTYYDVNYEFKFADINKALEFLNYSDMYKDLIVYDDFEWTSDYTKKGDAPGNYSIDLNGHKMTVSAPIHTADSSINGLQKTVIIKNGTIAYKDGYTSPIVDHIEHNGRVDFINVALDSSVPTEILTIYPSKAGYDCITVKIDSSCSGFTGKQIRCLSPDTGGGDKLVLNGIDITMDDPRWVADGGEKVLTL